jgi:hypothetical protein
MTVGERKTLQDSLDEVNESLISIDRSLQRLEKANRVHKVKFWVLSAVCVGLLALSAFVYLNARNAREDLAQTFTQTQFESCESSQDTRVRLRALFHQLFVLAAARSENPADVEEFGEQFDAAALEALPNRDCEQEEIERQEQG